MATTLMPLLIALVALVALHLLDFGGSAEAGSPFEDAGEWS